MADGPPVVHDGLVEEESGPGPGQAQEHGQGEEVHLGDLPLPPHTKHYGPATWRKRWRPSLSAHLSARLGSSGGGCIAR